MVRRNVPLVEQVILELLSAIDRGEYVRSNGMLPSEAELALHFSVSRATVRDALSRLEATGVIIRRQGVGTFVNQFLSKHPAALQDWFEEAHGFVDALRSMGRNPEVWFNTRTTGRRHGWVCSVYGGPVIIVEGHTAAPLVDPQCTLVAPDDSSSSGAELAGAGVDLPFRRYCHCRAPPQGRVIGETRRHRRKTSGEPCLQVEVAMADLAPFTASITSGAIPSLPTDSRQPQPHKYARLTQPAPFGEIWGAAEVIGSHQTAHG
jgi:DNA-binding transcriptional regulator YhcF (GntR family)